MSRDVTQLSADEVRQSAIESLAETNDSVVVRVLVRRGGPAGAALYRLANTADAMWATAACAKAATGSGGKWAAHADDVFMAAARITALLLALAGRGVRPRALAREARRTPSPNSGWPMAAMALALDVRLTKPACTSPRAGRRPARRMWLGRNSGLQSGDGDCRYGGSYCYRSD